MKFTKKRGFTRKLRPISRAGAVAAGLAVALTAGLAGPASADDPPTVEVGTSNDSWGKILPGRKCAQAHSWIASASFLPDITTIEPKMFEAHDPPFGNANATEQGFNIDLGVVGASAFRSIAKANHKGAPTGTTKTKFARCHAYAHANLGEIWVNLFGVELIINAITPWAEAKPGKPVKFGGGVVGGSVRLFGDEKKSFDANEVWPSDLGIRFGNPGEEILALITKEEVTTDENGNPTKDANGNFFTDPNAQSGYVNAIRASIFGHKGAELNLGHAAVQVNPKYMPAGLCKEVSADNARCITPAAG